MEKEILEFIRRRFPKQERWIEGNCYYFAVILMTRFGFGEIWYDTINGHFVYGDVDIGFYDQRGIYDAKDMNLVAWNRFAAYDATRYNRIIKGCIE